MQIIRDIHAFRQLRSHCQDKCIGLVATMGNLHAGHLALLERSVKENDITVLTLFVNPTQFNDPSDFENYPKTEASDLRVARQANVDWVLIPEDKDIYSGEFNFSLTCQHDLTKIFEAAQRPGHFEGVMTIVMKLLNIIKPHKAYFGEKDFQQLELIKQMTKAFFIDTEIIGCQTVREPSMLPFSSRNSRLTSSQKKQADYFSQVFHSSISTEQMYAELSAANIHVEYIQTYKDRIFSAINLNQIRIIDNKHTVNDIC